MDTRSIRFRLAIPAEVYLAYYKGQVRQVVVSTGSGQRIQFPASALQSVVGHQGVYGLFELQFDHNHKLLGLRRIGD